MYTFVFVEEKTHIGNSKLINLTSKSIFNYWKDWRA